MATTQQTPFEASLTRAFAALADRAPVEVDAVTLAASIARRGTMGIGARTRVFGRAMAPALLWLVLLGLLIALAAVAVGSLPQTRSIPLQIRGRWMMERPAQLGFGAPSGPSQTTLFLPPDGQQAFVTDTALAQTRLLSSSARASGDSELTFETYATVRADQQHQPGDAVAVDGTWLPGCVKGDIGRYRWILSSDQRELTLTAVTEACPSRAAAFEQTWTRAATQTGTPQ